MKAFLAVSAFFFVFVAVIGGGLFLSFVLVLAMHMPEDVENVTLCVGAVTSIVGGGLLMKRLHEMIQRRL